METTVVMMDGLKECYPEAEIVNADNIMVSLRQIKSENEIACIREGFRIAQIATDEVVKKFFVRALQNFKWSVSHRKRFTRTARNTKSSDVCIQRKEHFSLFPDLLTGSYKQGRHRSAQPFRKVDGYSPAIGIP